MSDPITAAAIGAGISGGTSLLRGKSLGSSLKNAAIGGALGGAGGYLGGAMGGAGGAGATTGGTTGNLGNAIATEGASNMGNIGMANVFNTGAGTTLGQAGTYAQGLNPELYTGSMGMFDVAKNSTLGYNPTFLGGQGPATFAGGGGYDTSLLGGLKRGVSGIMPGDVLMGNPVGYGNLALNAYGTMNQPQAPLQPSPMQSAQQLISGQSPVPTPQFNSLLQPSRRQILIG
jgi:hypothetical protein